ncbi:hypothetical protein NPIL_467621 [Nephila pilipes]|uniref:Uncharacterized protein n=1 Tax=Nephila pilipes TaxID=299642 RepID=A0A8X6QAI7_NEPPI|nr:hypothetical protein NPIL_467621 [Nephila pilipes]
MAFLETSCHHPYSLDPVPSDYHIHYLDYYLRGTFFLMNQAYIKHSQTSLRPKSSRFTAKGMYSWRNVHRRCWMTMDITLWAKNRLHFL